MMWEDFAVPAHQWRPPMAELMKLRDRNVLVRACLDRFLAGDCSFEQALVLLAVELAKANERLAENNSRLAVMVPGEKVMGPNPWRDLLNVYTVPLQDVAHVDDSGVMADAMEREAARQAGRVPFRCADPNCSLCPIPAGGTTAPPAGPRPGKVCGPVDLLKDYTAEDMARDMEKMRAAGERHALERERKILDLFLAPQPGDLQKAADRLDAKLRDNPVVLPNGLTVSNLNPDLSEEARQKVAEWIGEVAERAIGVVPAAAGPKTGVVGTPRDPLTDHTRECLAGARAAGEASALARDKALLDQVLGDIPEAAPGPGDAWELLDRLAQKYRDNPIELTPEDGADGPHIVEGGG
jgi:hypothetical protein